MLFVRQHDRRLSRFRPSSCVLFFEKKKPFHDERSLVSRNPFRKHVVVRLFVATGSSKTLPVSQ